MRINNLMVGLCLVAAATNTIASAASTGPAPTCPTGQQKFYISGITVTQGKGNGTADGFFCLNADAEKTEAGIKAIKDMFVKAGKFGKDMAVVLVLILPLKE